MQAKYNRFNPAEKVDIFKRHLVNKVSVSDISDELSFNHNVFYHWQKSSSN